MRVRVCMWVSWQGARLTKDSKAFQLLVDELVAEGLPILQPYISSSVKVRESHHAACPLVILEPMHKLSQEFEALHGTLEKAAKPSRKTKQTAATK